MKFRTFERIPLSEDYDTCKKDIYDTCNRYYHGKFSPSYSVNRSVQVAFFMNEGFIEENGMERFCVILSGFLYAMEHDDVASDLAFTTNWHIEAFESEGYDDLFTKEDLKKIKYDISRSKEYLKGYFEKHPEVLEQEIPDI